MSVPDRMQLECCEQATGIPEWKAVPRTVCMAIPRMLHSR